MTVYVVHFTRNGALNGVAWTTRELAEQWARLFTNGNYYIDELTVRNKL